MGGGGRIILCIPRRVSLHVYNIYLNFTIFAAPGKHYIPFIPSLSYTLQKLPFTKKIRCLNGVEPLSSHGNSICAIMSYRDQENDMYSLSIVYSDISVCSFDVQSISQLLQSIIYPVRNIMERSLLLYDIFHSVANKVLKFMFMILVFPGRKMMP